MAVLVSILPERCETRHLLGRHFLQVMMNVQPQNPPVTSETAEFRIRKGGDIRGTRVGRRFEHET